MRCDTVTRRSIAINQALKYIKESKLPYWVRIKQIRSDVLSVLIDYVSRLKGRFYKEGIILLRPGSDYQFRDLVQFRGRFVT